MWVRWRVIVDCGHCETHVPGVDRRFRSKHQSAVDCCVVTSQPSTNKWIERREQSGDQRANGRQASEEVAAISRRETAPHQFDSISNETSPINESCRTTLPHDHPSTTVRFSCRRCGLVEESQSIPVSATCTYLDSNTNSEPNANPPLIVEL